MLKTSAGTMVAIEEMADGLGISINKEEIIANRDTREKTLKALLGLEGAKESTPEYLKGLKEISEYTSNALARVAQATGSKQAHDLVKQYDEQIKTVVSSLYETGISRLSEDDKFGPNLKNICGTSFELLSNVKKLAGCDEAKKNNEISDLLMLMAMIGALLFMTHFGVPMEAISLAGVGLKFYLETKDKSALEKGKELCTRIINNSDIRQVLEEKTVRTLEDACPSLKNFNLREHILNLESKIQNMLETDLYGKTSSLLAALPDHDKTPEEVTTEIFTGLNKVIETSLAEAPELQDKLKSLLLKTKETNTSSIISALTNLTDNASQKSIFEKSKDILSSTSSIFAAIDNFKSLSNSEQFTAIEKVLVEKITSEMKQYIFDKNIRPVRDFCESASKSINCNIANKFGISKDTISAVNLALSKLDSSPTLSR